ncbi:RNA polymerase sigma factor [Pseudarthrobacter sp. S9]|uniref:RNA polymerase sigma factor n=1 Tax=Pseudarthrobacter sp. S9 TaxID=3418421 RepID=UPI003D00307B
MATLDGPELADTRAVRPGRADEDWVGLLSTPGPGHESALVKLHQLLLKAARHQVSQMYYGLPAIGAVRVDELINQAADEAMVAVLGKLSSFEGRSRFTTWAYKFGILHAAVEVRRNLWRHRDVDLESVPEQPSAATSPEQLAEGSELSAAVRVAIEEALTAHQRRIVLALLVDEVPIDVLADRLGTMRNALYKTLHDARGRLRAHLALAGYLTTPITPRGIS